MYMHFCSWKSNMDQKQLARGSEMKGQSWDGHSTKVAGDHRYLLPLCSTWPLRSSSCLWFSYGSHSPPGQIHHPVLWESAEDSGLSHTRSRRSHQQQHHGHVGLQRSAVRNLWSLPGGGSWADSPAASGDAGWHLEQGFPAGRALGTRPAVVCWGQG